jgi:hypothetical protein
VGWADRGDVRGGDLAVRGLAAIGAETFVDGE